MALRNRMNLLAVIAAIPMFGSVACVGTEETVAQSEDNLGRRVGAASVTTDRKDLRLLSGYNSLLDEKMGDCVRGNDVVDSPSISVGSVDETSAWKLIDSRDTLSKEMGLDLGLGIKYGPIGGRADFGFLNTYNRTNTSVSFLLKATISYTVTNLKSVRIEPESAALLEESPDKEFLRRCGDGFVSGIKYQNALYVMIRFDAATEEKAKEIRAELSGGGGFTAGGKGVEIDGNLKTRLLNAKTKQGVTASVFMTAPGFIASGAANTVVPLADGVSADTFAQLEGIRQEMGRSIRNDICRDGGDTGQCNGVDAPGYEANRSRAAVPVEVFPGTYGKAENAPSGDQFRSIRDKLTAVETYVRDYENLRMTMNDAYYVELKPFLGLPQTEQVKYNTMTGQALSRAADVRAYAESWAKKLQPVDDNGNVGELPDQLNLAVEACWKNAIEGDYSDCNIGRKASSQPAYKTVAAELAKYNKLVKLSYFPVGERSLGSAKNCYFYGSTGKMHLANKDEILRLAPVVAAASKEGKAWFDDNAGICDGDLQPYIESSQFSTGDARLMCHKDKFGFWNNWELQTFCVPDTGLFGQYDTLTK
ncbi:MAG: hypothetical protein KBF88_03410 [Polyangiaceae bacterium]|nr:hypothetical protein [Polyangiaceae bacterium]